MRHPDITILTAAPPNPVSQATVQVAGGPVGISTYFYWIVAHYPIGSVISSPFQVVGAPSPTNAQNYVIVSWDATGATSYDLLRTLDPRPPADGSNAALALGLTATIFRDQGQALSPYSLSGLTHGAPTDGWAHMNNRDYTEPVLELFPSVHVLKIIFPDGSSQITAGGGGSQGPPGPPGPQGPIGATGSTGPAGGQGPTGATGPPGSTGAQGPPGVQGATGQQGVPGPQGPAGTGVTIKGSVPTEADLPTTGNVPGDAWITSDTGHLWVWGGSSWVDAGVIQGPPGPAGPTGQTGLTGPEGPAGATGPAGSTGATGATGSPGSTGPTGSQGPQGIQGPQGLPGPVIPATATVLGGVKIGSNVSVLSDGTISVTPQASFQTPWLSNINGANFTLSSASAIGIGVAADTTAPLKVTAGGAERMRLTSAGKLGIGTAAPTADLEVIASETSNILRGVRSTQYSNDIFPASVFLMKYRGSAAAPAPVQVGDTIGQLSYDANVTGNTRAIGAYITAVATTVGPAGQMSAALDFSTNPGGTSPITRVRITQTGSMGIGTTAPQAQMQIVGLAAGQTTANLITTGNLNAVAYVQDFGSAGGNGGAILFGASQGAFAVIKSLLQQGGDNTAGDLAFSTRRTTTDAALTETMRITYQGAVCIGVTTPAANRLSISDTTTGTGSWAADLISVSQNGFRIRAGNAFATQIPVLYAGDKDGSGVGFTVTSQNNVGIGLTNPTAALQLATDSAVKPITNTWTITSDIRTKKNVRALEGGLNIINELEPIVAEYNGMAHTPEGSRVVSFDSATLREVLPHAVSSVRGKLDPRDAQDTDILGVNTHEVLFHLVLAAQQIDQRLKKLESEES